MSKWLAQWWKNYKYRFVPWIAMNVKHEVEIPTKVSTDSLNRAKESLKKQLGESPTSELINLVGSVETPQQMKGPVPVHHVRKSEEKLITNSELVNVLTNFFIKLKCEESGNAHDLEHVSVNNQKIMRDHFGFSVQRAKSLVSSEAGTGVFVTSGVAKKGSVVALYCGSLYMPHEPLFFPSLGNPFIFRCSDGIHIDGNDKWISKSIYKSCAARDKFNIDVPCCDLSWLTPHPINPLNIGQYVNNQSHRQKNNVVYQECLISQLELIQFLGNVGVGNNEFFHPMGKSYLNIPVDETLPRSLFKFLPNVWSDPTNNRYGLRLVPLIAIKDIEVGEEILSSYFTVVHPE